MIKEDGNNFCYLSDAQVTIQRQYFLDSFSAAVAKKQYEKIPYKDWRTITKDPHLNVNITKVGNRIYLYYEHMDFDINDGSLGQYLNFTYFTPCEGGENMNYDTCTIKSTVDYDKISGGAGNLYYSTGTGGEWLDYSSNINVTYPYFDEGKCREIVKDELKKEKEMTTNNLVKNFNFGPVSDTRVRMSPYGLAIGTSPGNWVAYNAANSEVIDVTEFVFNMSKWIYAMPVALSAIAAGDILVHNGKYVFVREVNNDGTINVLDYASSSVMNILPVKSPFGFNFYTKICPLVNIGNMTANADSPFGNMLPFLLMGEGKDFDPMMLMLMNGNTDFASNPLMMYALMKGDDGKIDPIVMMMLMNGKETPSI